MKGIWISFFAFIIIMMASPARTAVTRETFLHQAAALGDFEELSALLDRGADPEVRDSEGRTPLHRVCEDVPLTACARCQRVDILWAELEEDFMRLGTLVTKLKLGDRRVLETVEALDKLRERSCTRITRALLAAGAAVGASDARDRTPLHAACRRGAVDVLAALVAAGAEAWTNHVCVVPVKIASVMGCFMCDDPFDDFQVIPRDTSSHYAPPESIAVAIYDKFHANAFAIYNYFQEVFRSNPSQDVHPETQKSPASVYDYFHSNVFAIYDYFQNLLRSSSSPDASQNMAGAIFCYFHSNAIAIYDYFQSFILSSSSRTVRPTPQSNAAAIYEYVHSNVIGIYQYMPELPWTSASQETQSTAFAIYDYCQSTATGIYNYFQELLRK